MRHLIPAVFAGFLAILPATADAKPARCQITLGTDNYTGNCDFIPQRGGSFELLLPPEAQEILFISNLSISITAPGKGRLGGEDNKGRSYTAGQVRRDPKKPACWVGNYEDQAARICAY